MTRLHHYETLEDTRFLTVTRLAMAGERFAYHWGLSREAFAQVAAQRRPEGLFIEHFDVVGEGNAERYHVIYRFAGFAPVDEREIIPITP